jgi:hypothetical protein
VFAHNTQSYSPYEKVTRGDRKTTGVADHRNPLLSHANRLRDGKSFLDSSMIKQLAGFRCLPAETTAAPWASLSGNDGGADQERGAGVDGACSSTVNENCRDRQLFTANDRGTLSAPTRNLDVREEYRA